ncbi:DMT family transporter [Halobellus salinus]|nr:DMT family transporter [Halobellus salinus]
MRHQHLGLFLTMAGAALFGTLGIFGKLAPTAGLSAATLLSTRFLAATVIFWALLAASGHGRVRSRRLFAAELGLGVVYGMMSVAYFEGLAWLSAGVAALLLFTYPVQVTLGSAVLLDEPVTLPKLLALVAAVSGVGLVVGGGTEFALTGAALVGLASVCYTVYSMGTRVMMADLHPLVHAAHTFLGVTATVLGYGAVTDALSVPATTAGWWLIAGITVVGTVVPILLFSAGLARIEASRASIVSTSEPLTTVGLGIVLLGEAFTVVIGLGAALILSGVVLTAPGVERAVRGRLADFGADRTPGREG